MYAIKRDQCVVWPPNPTFREKGQPAQIMSRACERVRVWLSAKTPYRHIQVLAHTSFFSLEMLPSDISTSVGSCAADALGCAGTWKATLGSWKCVWCMMLLAITAGYMCVRVGLWYVCLHVCVSWLWGITRGCVEREPASCDHQQHAHPRPFQTTFSTTLLTEALFTVYPRTLLQPREYSEMLSRLSAEMNGAGLIEI